MKIPCGDGFPLTTTPWNAVGFFPDVPSFGGGGAWIQFLMSVGSNSLR